MKLVVVILSNKDLSAVLSELSRQGYFVTKIATAGQFLQNGQTTLLIGAKEERVEPLFDLLEKNVTKRIVRHQGVESTVEGSLLSKPVDVEENGAVAFVINVENFRKI